MTNARSPDIAHHAALDARMTKAAREIRLLSLVSWPASEQQQFLAEQAQGRAKLPFRASSANSRRFPLLPIHLIRWVST